MIVISRNGKTTVLTGWRAWGVGFAVALAVWVAFSILAVVVAGTALTIGLVLLMLVPAAGLAALLQLAFGRRR